MKYFKKLLSPITILLFILTFGLSISSKSQAKKQDTLSNKSIVVLKKSGIDKKIILLKIKNSSCDFDLSTNGIVELKNNGVDEDIIEAMLNKEYSPIDNNKTDIVFEKKLDNSASKNNSLNTNDSSNAIMNYDGKNCVRAAISAQMFDANDRNMIGLRINKGLYINFLLQMELSNGTIVKMVMRKLKFSGTKAEPEKFYFLKVSGYNSDDLFVKNNVDEDWENYFYITYTKGKGAEGVANFPRKLGFRKSYLKVTSIDKNERTLSGEINVDAETTDGTPLKIVGIFTNVSYDGGNITQPLYQR